MAAKEHSTIKEFCDRASTIGAGEELLISGLSGPAAAYALSRVFATKRRLVAVLATDDEAEAFAKDLAFFVGAKSVAFYPSSETPLLGIEPVHPDIACERMEFLSKLSDPAAAFIGISAASNLLRRIPPQKKLEGKAVVLRTGGLQRLEDLVLLLADGGYSRVSLVEERGEMSVRGGIVDIFPPGFKSPVRVEFSGDEIESIRAFDISTQRSIEALDEARILPAREVGLGSKDARARLIDRADALLLDRAAWEAIAERLKNPAFSGVDSFLPLLCDELAAVFDLMEGVTLAVIDPSSVKKALLAFDDELIKTQDSLIEKRVFHVDPKSLYLGAPEALARISMHPRIGLEPLLGEGLCIRAETNRDIRIDVSARKEAELPLRPLARRLAELTGEGWRAILTAHNSGQAHRTTEIFEAYGLRPCQMEASFLTNATVGSLSISIGSLSRGFRLPDELLAIITEEEIFGERQKRRAPPTRKLDAFLAQLQDLSPGDLIVHARHGIGVYRGLKRISIEGVENDFLLAEYRGEDKLYVPVLRMDLISKYHGTEETAPLLDKLGGAGWEKTKKSVKKAVEKLAGELLKLYAERQVAEGHAFSKSTPMFEEFEQGFEFEETPDQARAIDECLRDMEEERPMDRLVCGDVGYGKTEVAMRAAFKAVLDKKQVALLVPTTILAQQHFETFTKRFAPYPVVVDVISRFKDPKEQKQVLSDVKQGRVDILIGTHRLLQKDVEFLDLGLIVIDEEHRFGVAHKERLKQLRKKVDVLTLTATPIPRTLQMSLGGSRELSVINTPPEDRLAIKTSVIRFDEDKITEAITREISRGGQVFFVHNRVQSMGAMEELLRRIVPGVRIAVAHGQMKEGELEKKMLSFINKEADILLSTAIIESGLDIPSANTIIIDRADCFGLAELYQLRGRVGRSSHRAYAYCICPETSELTEDARKRIEVIQELSDPGSGFRIAAHDLEIRGAGEFLGARQSGHIAAVGFEMYAELLDEAVRELRGEEVSHEVEPEINLKVAQYFPDDYVPDVRQRLGLYKRLSSVKTVDDIEDIRSETIDRYGPMGELAQNLFSLSRIRLALKSIGAVELTQIGQRLYFGLGPSPHEDAARGAIGLTKKDPVRFRAMPDNRLAYIMPPGTDPIEASFMVLKELSHGCYI